jgi:hypothetical protein
MVQSVLGESPRLKIELMFEGLRYSDALGAAAASAFPNFYPYRFADGEPNPTGQPKVPIPYLLRTSDGTLVRIKGNGASPWQVAGDAGSSYRLIRDGHEHTAIPIEFEPLPRWMGEKTHDGFPMAQAGVSLHGDMAVVNVAPGCEYFLHKHDGAAMRCTFCSYGAPDQRTAHLGQVAGQVDIPELTLHRMQETLTAALAETDINHIYLVGGSLTDWHQEAHRFIQLARAVKAVNPARIPVSLGSGALPADELAHFHGEQLVDNVCFNLEIFSQPLFAKVCPGKQRYVGYQAWIDSLEAAVALWGRERVYSAMVAGIELEPEHNMTWQRAAAVAVQGAEYLCARGIIPIYSLYWPVGGRNHPEYFSRLKHYFETLNQHYFNIRRKHGLNIWDGFMCHRCAYMQLECDVDRAAVTKVA